MTVKTLTRNKRQEAQQKRDILGLHRPLDKHHYHTAVQRHLLAGGRHGGHGWFYKHIGRHVKHAAKEVGHAVKKGVKAVAHEAVHIAEEGVKVAEKYGMDALAGAGCAVQPELCPMIIGGSQLLQDEVVNPQIDKLGDKAKKAEDKLVTKGSKGISHLASKGSKSVMHLVDKGKKKISGKLIPAYNNKATPPPRPGQTPINVHVTQPAGKTTPRPVQYAFNAGKLQADKSAGFGSSDIVMQK